MEAKDLGVDDLLLCGVEDAVSSDHVYQTGLVLLEQPGDATIALVHTGHSFLETIALKIHQWVATIAPPMEREQRIELAQNLQTGSRPNLEFLGLISASSMLAAFGLLQDSAAVIIGAMLIAPLMTPIVGAGLALSQGNRPLFQSAAVDHHAGVRRSANGEHFVWMAVFVVSRAADHGRNVGALSTFAIGLLCRAGGRNCGVVRANSQALIFGAGGCSDCRGAGATDRNGRIADRVRSLGQSRNRVCRSWDRCCWSRSMC